MISFCKRHMFAASVPAALVIGVAGEFWWCLSCVKPFDLLLFLLPVNTALVALRTAINALKRQ